MTQPKRSSSSKSSSSKSSSSTPAAKRSAAAKKAATTRKAAANKRSATAKKSAATRKAAAAKQAPKRAAAAKSPQAASSAAGDGVTAAIVALRDAVSGRAIDPLNVLMISRDRLQETLDSAVERGHMTREAANSLAVDLAERGLREWQDVLADIEQLLGRVKGSGAADIALQGVDRARRAVGVGSAFPISNYDDLTAAQVSDRLGGLTPAELRKTRDYERRHGNRKSVLAAIEKQLS